LHVLQVHDWLALYDYGLRYFTKLQLGVHGGSKAGGDDNSGFTQLPKSLCRDGDFIRARRQEIKQIAAVPLC
jgi:hypothetical protein